jgi:mRNA interferase MazF
MRVTRGEVVLVDFPFAGGGRSKLRPALVIQNDRDNQRLSNTIVAMISSKIARSQFEDTQIFLSFSIHGSQTGLRVDSIVNCVNLFTIERTKVLRTLGVVPSSLMPDIQAALKSVFGLA